MRTESPMPGRSFAVLIRRTLMLAAAVIIVVAIASAFHLTSFAAPPPPSLPPAPVPATMPATMPEAHVEYEEASAVARVDDAWLSTVAAGTGIPARALAAYAAAHLAIGTEDPGCGIGWNTLAAIGQIESEHGTHDGAVLGADGYPTPAIVGIALDGNGVAAIADTDGGIWDSDHVWDRAVGPTQFIPDTWVTWGADGNGDGTVDPNSIDDAALSAARYLCAAGAMNTPEGWRAAVFSYNQLDSYVDQVARTAHHYAGLL